MLDGITVLNKVELVDLVTSPAITTAIWVLLIFTIVFCLVGTVGLTLNKRFTLPFVSAVLSFIGVLILLGMSYEEKIEVPNGKYEYQVTIDNSVSFVEFNSMYDLIKVDGEIYTIREKENN